MVRVLRLLVAVAAIPLAWGISLAFIDVLRLVPVASGVLAVFAGLVVHLVVWMVFPSPVRAYVLGHELTHAVCGLLFGARVSKLRVGATGGSVTLSKSNVWITLAPYFFPFYTILVAVAALVVRAFRPTLPCPGAWLFAVGFTWCFHLCFTIRSILQKQPDIQECGYAFSYVLIWIFNVAGVCIWIVCAAGIPWRQFGPLLLARVSAAYLSVASCAVWGYESLRALPVLQG
ncbi:MAG: hypothetical protein ACI4RA_01295 [Kiritimatiellia bacterium]